MDDEDIDAFKTKLVMIVRELKGEFAFKGGQWGFDVPLRGL